MDNQVYRDLGGFLYIVISIFGLSFGSFLNSWIWRRHENIRISRGRSICPACRRQLNWYENVPVFSYLILRGKCRTCRKHIPSHFLWVELGTALLFLFITWYHLNSSSFNFLNYNRDVFFIGILLVIFIFDFLYKIIPSEIIWIGVAGGCLYTILCVNHCPNHILLSSLLGGGFFFLQYIISKGKWIGGGDVRMGLMMGVWLGWPGVLVALIIAYVSGAIVCVLLLAFSRKNMKSQIPFGTFLAVATMFSMFYAQEVINWYIGLIR
ncbi:MAG: prepilin peptidase [bacterium]